MSKSLGKGLELLVVLRRAAERGETPLALGDVARLAGLEKTTTFRLLRTLVAGGFAGKDDAGRYDLGGAALALARTAFDTNALLRKSLPLMVALQQATNETVTLAQRRDRTALTVHALHSDQLVRYMASVGAIIPLHLGASARAILAFSAPAVVRDVLAGPLEAPTGASIADASALAASLDEVRRTGYAISAGERTRGATAIAVPLLDPLGIAVGSVAVLAPERGPEIDAERRARWPPLLLAAVGPVQRTF